VKNQWIALREKKERAPSELANSIGASTVCNIAESLDANVTELFPPVPIKMRLEELAAKPWYVRLFLGRGE